MSAVNPYAPPEAAVADVVAGDQEGGVQPVKIFSTRGRIGRLRYLAYSMAGYLLMVTAAAVVGAVVGGMAGNTTLASVGGGLMFIPYVAFIALITIQRSHDMDWSGWTALLAFIPLVGLVWIFNSGTQGKNRFGAPPPPNTFGVKFIAWLLPAIAVIGIMAAIAIPAYMGYQQKAKAAQMK